MKATSQLVTWSHRHMFMSSHGQLVTHVSRQSSRPQGRTKVAN